jgi:hypothetical protein
MQSARDPIPASSKLSAGMKFGQHYGYRRQLGFFVNVYRDSPSVIGYGNTIIGVDNHFYLFAIAGHRFINTIIYYFV